ncbi:hypothetical protein NP493_874g01045 [Ridgeia piscesae]|uniref:G-protein coupled receptors family 2 profile 2 domain-containing protein n=1 Tax=Ridgeia piscesae TaxID=27915 RepID=A0AAD9KKU8_RIDPI|nr:hypothetical protein NP493_874g01045 [Ridgeia piscesae]
MTDLSLLLTNERSRISSDGACVAMAMFRHFAILHQLLAVSVYARHIVSAITDRSDGDHVTNKHFLLKGALLAYGMPLVLVMISACVDTGAYLSNEHSCRLGSTNLYIYISAYVTPACLTLLANCCLAVLIIRALLTSHSRKPHDYTISDGQVYVSLVVISETSVTWIMGVISSRHLVETHQFYVTCCYFALRAFLGASALVCFCLLNPDARAVWRQLCRRSGTLTRRTQYPPGGTAITYKTPASPRGRYVNDYTLVIDSSNGLPQNLRSGDRLSGVPTICINGRRTPSMASMVMGDDDDVSQRAPSVPCSRSGSTSEFGSRIGSFKPTCAFERTDATDNREM